ncbi:MAG: hypothetical protein KF850_33920 [Labilithrix sp.]|nr:hypothetical protein [Labilithrix sp.]
MLRRALLTTLALCLAAACAEDPAPPAEVAPPDEAACPEGEMATPDGCATARPAGPCPAGTREALGSEACTPVGVASCASGFEPHPSGWGCRPVLPAAACAGATREVLGQDRCAPLGGDCGAAFPPAGATHTVDAALADGAVDATHFKSLAAALAAAPAGATIAIESGRYAESVTLTKPVTIVGRCAARVVLEGSAGAAVVTVSDRTASLRGITLAGGSRGLRAEGTARVTLEDALLEDNAIAGIDAFDGAEVDAARVVVRGTHEVEPGALTNGVLADAAAVRLVDSVVAGAADAGLGTTGGGSLRLERVIVRDTVPRSDGVGGLAVRAFLGSEVELIESAVVGSRGVAILGGGRRTAVVLERSSVVDTRLDDRPSLRTSTGISIQDGAALTLSGATVADGFGVGVAVRKGGASASIDQSVVVNIGPDGLSGNGVGLMVSDVSRVEVKDSAVVAATFSGVMVDLEGAELTLERSLIAESRRSPGGGKVPVDSGGYAVIVNRGATATVRASTLVDAKDLAAVAAVEGSILTVDGTLVARTKSDARDRFGHGLVSLLGGRLLVQGATLEANAGVGLLFDRGGGIVRDSVVVQNAVGVHVQQGAELIEGEPGDEATNPGEVWISPDTRFIGNVTRVGSGILAVPELL